MALPYLERFFEKNKLSPNPQIRLPIAPRKGLLNEDDSFSDSLLKWLGGEQDRRSIGRGVKIALLDSGVNQSHPMLESASISEKNFLPSINGNESNHGTAMASVMVGGNTHFSGISPLSEILSYRIIDQDGTTDTHTVALAIVDAVGEGADIINLSLGGRDRVTCSLAGR